MKLRKTLCFLLAMIMAFAIAFPGSIFAEEYFPEEELVFEEENSFSDNWIEEELIDELTSSDIVDDYYEDWIEDEFVDYDQPSLNEEVELVEEDEVLLEEPTEEADNEVPDTEDTEVIGELVLVDNETFEAASSINITKQPKDVTAKLGEYATVSVTAEGSNLTYQWYYKTVNDSQFKASSAKTNEYRIKMMTQWDGMEVYCQIKSGSETVDSDVATLRIGNGITITKQPKDVTAKLNEYATVSVEAEGDNLTYQWFYKAAGSSEFKASSAKTNEYRIRMTTQWDGMQVYCQIKSGSETVDTDVATLHVGNGISITEQPKDVTAKLNEYATVSVVAEGDNLTYQWFYKASGSSEFKASSAKTNEYRIRMTTQWDGMQVYCQIKSGSETVDTDVATITLANIVSEPFVFKIIENTNNLALIGYTGSASSVEVPDSVDGMTVTEIGVSPLGEGEKGVFEGNTTLTSIKLPNTITAIREKSFKGCTNLSTMTTY